CSTSAGANSVFFRFRTSGTAPAAISALSLHDALPIYLVFGFVPATIGVYEGGTGFILHTLGYAVATGVTIGIVRKASMMVWALIDRKSTRLNSSHVEISYAVFCLKKTSRTMTSTSTAR